MRGQGFVVRGGTARMGLAAARALAREGPSVVVVGRDADRSKKAAEEVAAAGSPSAHGLAFDVSQPGAAVAAVDEAVRILGRLDGIAITMGTAGMMPIDSDDDAWDTAFHDVLLATTRSVQAALPHLAETKGAVVTTAAYSARPPHDPRLPYASLKAAVATFTRGIARTHGKSGIRRTRVPPAALRPTRSTSV